MDITWGTLHIQVLLTLSFEDKGGRTYRPVVLINYIMNNLIWFKYNFIKYNNPLVLSAIFRINFLKHAE
jgi:hypothetical protein